MTEHDVKQFIEEYDLGSPLAEMAFDHWSDQDAINFLGAAFAMVRKEFEAKLHAASKAREGQ